MKTRHLLCAVGLGFGLAVVLLLTLARSAPVAQAGGVVHYYYVREGATGDCLSVTTPCSSVVYAVGLAVASGGNEVWVAAGTYTENLEITRGLSLRGGWDTSFTVQNPVIYTATIEGGSATHVISANVGTDDLLIEGLTLRNGVDGIHLYGDALAASGAAGGNAATVVSNTVRGADYQGIEVDGGHVLLTGNLVTDIGREGIETDSGMVVVRGNTVDGVGRHGILVEGGSVTIEDNVIHDVQGAGYHGVRLRADGVIRGNHVYQIAGRGIDARSGASTIADNLVHDTGGDSIYTHSSSTDVEIRGNTIYNAGNDGIDARGTNVLVAHNAVSGCVDNGIKAEGIGNWVSIEANRVLSNATVGIAVRQAPVFTLTNNVVSDHISGSVELGGTGAGFVYHNTLVGSEIAQQGTGISVTVTVTVTGAAVTLANNVVVSHTVGITKAAGAALVVSHTLLWHNGSDPISGTTVITQAPLFVAPASHDYHLLPGSPGVDGGIDVGVRTDVDGDPRLGIPDVGADEVVWKVYLPLVMRDY